MIGADMARPSSNIPQGSERQGVDKYYDFGHVKAAGDTTSVFG